MSPPPSPAPEGAPTTAPYAHLWLDPNTWDTVVQCGTAGWLVHRHVLARMSEWLDENLPYTSADGEPGVWSPDPATWGPARLEAIFRFMYFEDYPTGHYDPNNPSEMTPITDNIAHYVCGGAVMCRPMMDEAVRRIDKARTEIIQQMPVVLQDRRLLDNFEHGFRLALINMYAEPNQLLLQDLRIAVGKLVADIFPFILQHPEWTATYERMWGMLRVRVVADHKWLYQVGLCEKKPVIERGFEHMAISWQDHRQENWQPGLNTASPQIPVNTAPPPPPPSTQQSRRTTTRAIPIVTPDGTVTPRSGTTAPRTRGGRGRGRGGPGGLVEPAPQPARGKGKKKEKMEPQASENSEPGPSEQGESSSASQATQATTTPSTATTEAGPSDAGLRAEQPIRHNAERRAYWMNVVAQLNQPSVFTNMAYPSSHAARRPLSPARPSSSSSALSARAGVFRPGEPSVHPATAGPSSYVEDTPTTLPPRVDTATSDAYLNDPARQAELYGPREPLQGQDKGKGKDVARSTTTGESSRQSESMAPTEGESSRSRESTEQLTQAFTSFDISEKETSDDTRPAGPSAPESHDEDET